MPSYTTQDLKQLKKYPLYAVDRDGDLWKLKKDPLDNPKQIHAVAPWADGLIRFKMMIDGKDYFFLKSELKKEQENATARRKGEK